MTKTARPGERYINIKITEEAYKVIVERAEKEHRLAGPMAALILMRAVGAVAK